MDCNGNDRRNSKLTVEFYDKNKLKTPGRNGGADRNKKGSGVYEIKGSYLGW